MTYIVRLRSESFDILSEKQSKFTEVPTVWRIYVGQLDNQLLDEGLMLISSVGGKYVCHPYEKYCIFQLPIYVCILFTIFSPEQTKIHFFIQNVKSYLTKPHYS